MSALTSAQKTDIRLRCVEVARLGRGDPIDVARRLYDFVVNEDAEALVREALEEMNLRQMVREEIASAIKPAALLSIPEVGK